MSPEAQRIAIAEACGWKRIEKPTFSDGLEEMRARGLSPFTREYWEVSQLRDYLNDLNAMHDAEQHIKNQFTLTEQTYWGHLRHVQPHPIYATASQRADAFLRTLNLWADET